MTGLDERMRDFRPRIVARVDLAGLAPFPAGPAAAGPWEEAEHPRRKAGEHGGGQFARKPGARLPRHQVARQARDAAAADLAKMLPGEHQPDARKFLYKAAQAFVKHDWPAAGEALRTAADFTRDVRGEHEQAYREFADRIDPEHAPPEVPRLSDALRQAHPEAQPADQPGPVPDWSADPGILIRQLLEAEKHPRPALALARARRAYVAGDMDRAAAQLRDAAGLTPDASAAARFKYVATRIESGGGAIGPDLDREAADLAARLAAKPHGRPAPGPEGYDPDVARHLDREYQAARDEDTRRALEQAAEKYTTRAVARSEWTVHYLGEAAKAADGHGKTGDAARYRHLAALLTEPEPAGRLAGGKWQFTRPPEPGDRVEDNWGAGGTVTATADTPDGRFAAMEFDDQRRMVVDTGDGSVYAVWWGGDATARHDRMWAAVTRGKSPVPHPPKRPAATGAPGKRSPAPAEVAAALDAALKADHAGEGVPGDDVDIDQPENVNFFGNTNDTRVVDFADGSTWIRKRSIKDRDADAELAYSRVSAVLGTGSPQVIERRAPDGQREIWEPYVDGITAVEWTGGQDPTDAHYDANLAEHDPFTLIESPEGRMIGLADLITGTSDRHAGNWMVTKDENGEHPVGIDQGTATFNEDAYSVSVFATRPYLAKLWQEHPAAQWDEWRAGLEALAPEFGQLGRPEWLDHLLGNFDQARAEAETQASRGRRNR